MKNPPTTHECMSSADGASFTNESSSLSSCYDLKTNKDILPVFNGAAVSSRLSDVPEVALSASDQLASRETHSSQTQAPQAEVVVDNWNSNHFRNDYIQRLANMKIIRQQRQNKPHQTLAIFDWDDTLFPTTFLKHIGFEKSQADPKILNAMSKIDALTCRLLQKATRVGITYIITNAVKNWVESSCETYLPMTYELIKSSQITIISARTEYEKLYPNEPKKWKQEAFLGLKEKLEDSVLTNLICVGDSTAELEAAQHICSILNQTILKTVKFKKCPRIEELAKQLHVVIEKFDQIYMTLRSLTIKVEKKN